MSDAVIQEITEGFRRTLGENSGFNAKLKFDFEGKGIVLLDGKSVPNSVSNANDPADCTIVVSLETFEKMIKREIDPTMAFMQGKLKVQGDMSVAMRLGPILQKAGQA